MLYSCDIQDKGLLFRTVSYRCDAALKVLLQRGASPNRVDEYGQSVLLVAVLNGSENNVRTLLENGADIEMGHLGMVAIELDDLPIVAILLG